jgi:hypothetical protein
MNCQKCKIEIDERNLRREWLSDAATAHMAACASCRLFGEERLALSRLVGGLEKVSAPADFDFRMRARMAAEASARAPRSGWFNFSPAALSWPLAACFALVVSASFYFQQQPEPAATNTPAAPSRIAVLETPTTQTSNRETISQSVPAVDDETRQGMDATASKNTLAARRRVSPAGRVAMNTTVDPTRIRERSEDSNSASLLPGAPVRFAANGATQGERALIPVQVSAEERPLKVLLRDTGGGARTISVESVSFGSRDVIGRPATISKASLSTNQGVW